MANVKFNEVVEKFVSISGTKDEDGNLVYLINNKIWCRDWQLPIEVLEEKKPGSYIKQNAKEIKFFECVHKAMDTAKDPISGTDITFKTEGVQRKLIDIIF